MSARVGRLQPMGHLRHLGHLGHLRHLRHGASRGHPVARRWAMAVTVVGGLLVGQALPAQAWSGSFDDQQIAQLTRVGAVRGSGGLELHLTSRDTVRASNLAVATTTCDDCRATAISFQVVVADHGPTTIDVGNLAYAANQSCARCGSAAVAYQFVIAYGSPVTMTESGRRRLRGVDEALRRLARSGRSVADVQAAADGYAATVMEVLATEIHVRPALHKDVRHIDGPGGDDRGHRS